MLASRNDELIAGLLAPLASTLTVLQAPFAASSQWTDACLGFLPVWTMTARLPRTIKDARGLRVVLRSDTPRGGFWSNSHIFPTVSQAQELAALLPEDATVEVHETDWSARDWIEKAKKNVEDDVTEWSNWTWVDQAGEKFRFGPKMLKVSQILTVLMVEIGFRDQPLISRPWATCLQ